MIKYKGQTSEILKELSLALHIPVQLKTAEEVLSSFFSSVTQHLSAEKNILLLTQLPPSLKSFCRPGSKGIGSFPKPEVVSAVFSILDKHVPATQLTQVYSCFPEELFLKQSGLPKEKFLKTKTI